MINEKDIKELGQLIINELGKELIKQDHKATGNLISSLNYRVENSLLSTDLIIEMNDYGTWVNLGRKKGAAKVPIKALVEWIKQKGIETNNKKVVGIAFAIQKTIEREGIPTTNSRKRGKRVGFVDDVIDRLRLEIEQRITELASKEVEIIIDNFVERI